jgi:vesicle-associated membrane protein 7
MTILYALVSRKKSVLAEFTSSSGNFPTVTRVLLSKIPDNDSKMSYEYDKYRFHYIVDSGITFLCMSDEGTKNRTAFSFLEEIKKVFRERYSSVEQNALAFSLNELFSPTLHQRIDFYNTNPSADNISRVQLQIDTVKDVMIENIDRVLERGERIELLVDKTENLHQQAFKFEKSSRNLKNTMQYRKWRNICIGVTVLVVVITFTVVMICGFDFARCKKK